MALQPASPGVGTNWGEWIGRTQTEGGLLQRAVGGRHPSFRGTGETSVDLELRKRQQRSLHRVKWEWDVWMEVQLG